MYLVVSNQGFLIGATHGDHEPSRVDTGDHVADSSILLEYAWLESVERGGVIDPRNARKTHSAKPKTGGQKTHQPTAATAHLGQKTVQKPV
jgi:hypothetical protein